MLGLPPHCRFQGTEIPKHLPYSHPIVFTHGQGLIPTAAIRLPGCGLFGRNYRLELFRDPQSLRPVVPSLPDFSSDP